VGVTEGDTGPGFHPDERPLPSRRPGCRSPAAQGLFSGAGPLPASPLPLRATADAECLRGQRSIYSWQWEVNGKVMSVVNIFGDGKKTQPFF